MAQPADKPDEQPKEKSLGGPFDPPGQKVDVIGDFVQQLNSASPDCKALYKSNKTAQDITALQFDSCYYGQTNKAGRSLELTAPVMKPGADGTPRPEPEKLTTEGLTKDSRRLDVYVHALPAVRPVSFAMPDGKTVAGTAAMITQDGLMVTNKHVTDGSNGTLQVKMLRPDGTEELRNARVVKENPGQDLALLQVDRAVGETFAALPLSKSTSWRKDEPLVEMGNANGEGKISMAKATYGRMLNQSDINFKDPPADVLPGRTVFQLGATVPHGYSGGVLLSLPGSDKDSNGVVHRNGTSAIRGVTVYSDLDHKSYIIPAARVQFMLDQYLKERDKK